MAGRPRTERSSNGRRYSIQLTQAEYALVAEAAGDIPVATYTRETVLLVARQAKQKGAGL